MHDAEMIAQELSALGHKLDELETRLAAVETVNTRLEEAALTTARARLGRSQVTGTRSMRLCAARTSPKRLPSTDSRVPFPRCPRSRGPPEPVSHGRVPGDTRHQSPGR